SRFLRQKNRSNVSVQIESGLLNHEKQNGQQTQRLLLKNPIPVQSMRQNLIILHAVWQFHSKNRHAFAALPIGVPLRCPMQSNQPPLRLGINPSSRLKTNAL